MHGGVRSNRLVRSPLLIAAAALTVGFALILWPGLRHFGRDDSLQLRVYVRDPASPTGLAVVLTLPVEGRGDGDRTVRDVTLSVTPVDVATPTIFRNLTSDAAGVVRAALPYTVFIPDGTDVVLAVKTPQTLQRVVRGTAQRATVTVDLRDARTFREHAQASLRGVPYLPVGDIEGIGGTLHDNVVNSFDVQAWVEAFRSTGIGIPADLNASGEVGAEDLSLLIRNYNTRGDSEGVR